MECIYYCRAGYEADLQQELQTKLGLLGQYGYAKFKKNQALLTFDITSINAKPDASNMLNALLQRTPALSSLVFARQKLALLCHIDLPDEDRITPIIEALQKYDVSYFGDIVVEYADTEDGKQIAKFCKKFTVPLRNHLRKSGLLTKNPREDKAYVHLLFATSKRCALCLSHPQDRSHYPLGVKRLKMPVDSPSRSVLKLDEAIHSFFNVDQKNALFQPGMQATDLGACPGGWSYQLVQLGLSVEAVDHGLIQTELMQTGKVKHFSEDGFLYQPQQGNVDWLVCDMIEQPTRVSELMLKWLIKGWANACIFNLKLPMNKRSKVVFPILEHIQKTLSDQFGDSIVQAKHLYHNRDEVTVLIIVNSQLVSGYTENL